VTHQKQIKED